MGWLGVSRKFARGLSRKMLKRKVEVDAELPVAKHCKQELFTVIQYLLPHFTPSDILATIRVCKEWREVILQNLPQWCSDLVQHKVGFLPKDSSPKLQKRNCVFQLYELLGRKLIDAPSYDKYKASLDFDNSKLTRKHANIFVTPNCGQFAYISREKDNKGLDFVGIERRHGEINSFTDAWYKNLKSVTEEFQIFLIHTYRPRWEKLHVLFTFPYQLSLVVLQRCAECFQWDGIAAPRARIDPNYLWNTIPLLKRRYTGDLNEQLYFIFVREDVAHYFPLLWRWCVSEEGAKQLFKRYQGGLSDEEVKLLADTMPPKYLKQQLRKTVTHYQFAKIADLMQLSTRSTWQFCFRDAKKSKAGYNIDTSRALAHLIQTRKLLVVLKNYIKERHNDGIALHEKYYAHATYRRGQFVFGIIHIDATPNDVYECFLPLLPIHENSVSWTILEQFYYGSSLPLIFYNTTRRDQKDLRKYQKAVLRERYPAQ
jgi:hypothetical protein